MASIHEMTSNFHKLDKFEGVGFHRWQKKMHFRHVCAQDSLPHGDGERDFAASPSKIQVRKR